MQKCLLLRHSIIKYLDLFWKNGDGIFSMKSSIRRQILNVFIGLMFAIILLCGFMNTLFLEEYYTNSKQAIIYDAYSNIRQAAGNDMYDSAAFKEELESICSRYNLTVFVLDSNSETKFVSSNGGELLGNKLIGYIFGFSTEHVEVLEQGEDFIIQKTGPEGDEYLEMYGRLKSGISFIISTPMESIRESAKIANRFFAYVGCMATVAGIIVFWFVSRKLTKPVLELNHISERMVHLDFEAKYQGKAQNEIDMLGENINQLSEALETAISELKTANVELQKDIDKKDKIDEMRREFLANVSHELKTPIALIQGYAEGLQEGISDNAESREFYCEVIVDEAAKMNRMVQKLMTLNELEFGQNNVSMERFDIVSVIKGCMQSAAILTEQNGIRVRMNQEKPIYVWADEYQTEEAFLNYFSNAVNHCKGEKLIDVKLEIGDGKVTVSVFNTGEPIPEDAIPHLWEKFYKVDKARTRAYGGSGVGLSIVKAIMDSMNREYGVENYANGVLFWFDLETVQE